MNGIPFSVYNALSSVANFIAYQEQLINRPLSEAEKEVTAAWLPVIDEATEDDIQAVDKLIAQHRKDEWSYRFLSAAKVWMMEAIAWKN